MVKLDIINLWNLDGQGSGFGKMSPGGLALAQGCWTNETLLHVKSRWEEVGSRDRNWVRTHSSPPNPGSTAIRYSELSSGRKWAYFVRESWLFPTCINLPFLGSLPICWGKHTSCQRFQCKWELFVHLALPGDWPAALPYGTIFSFVCHIRLAQPNQSFLGSVLLLQSVATVFKDLINGCVFLSPRKEMKTVTWRCFPPSCFCCSCKNGAENYCCSFIAQLPMPLPVLWKKINCFYKFYSDIWVIICWNCPHCFLWPTHSSVMEKEATFPISMKNQLLLYLSLYLCTSLCHRMLMK